VLVGLISDLHCNAEALAIAMADLSHRVDEIVMAGDAMHEYRFSNEAVEAAREHEMHYVLGNHEMMILSHHGDRARSLPTVRASNVEFLAGVPTRIDTKLNGKRMCVVHGSPWAPYSDYLYVNSPILQRADELETDILVLGHTHARMAQRFGRTLVVNPGSLGADNRDGGDRSRVSYAVLDTSSEEVEFIDFPNPRLAALGAI
jgi:putative phosphoesterase